MTAPGNGLGGLVGVGGGLVLNPDGSANISASVGGAQAGAALTHWDLPTDVPTGAKIWFDTEYSRQANSEPTSSTAAAENGTPNPITSYHTSGSKQVPATPAQIFAQFAALSAKNPNEFLALQKALNAWSPVNENGVWGPQTERALKAAMSSYWQLSHGAGVAMSFHDYMLQAGAAVAAKQQQAQANSIPRVMDPAQIRAAAQNAAQQALGQGLSAKQLDQFVQQFQQEQLSNQSDPYTTSYKLPGEAMQFAQNANPTEYRENQAQTFANVLVNMFAPSASQRPNMQPTPSA